jgi:hypothetical protein
MIDNCPNCDESINHCVVDELLSYSLNVQELENITDRICKIISNKRGIDPAMNAKMEFRLWRVQAFRIHTAYMNNAEFNKQQCVTANINKETINKLASELALTHEPTIHELIIKRDKEACKELNTNTGEIKLMQHILCKGCVAEKRNHFEDNACYLGYQTKREWVGGVKESIPCESCPKPLNHEKLIIAIMLFNKNKNIHIEQVEPEFMKDEPTSKRKCYGCKALMADSLPEQACELAYYTELRIIDGKIEIAPKEPCPHPKYADDLHGCKMTGRHKWNRGRDES